MKTNRRIISIMIMLIMIMTSAMLTVFATGEEPAADNADNQEAISIDDFDFEEAEPAAEPEEAAAEEQSELELVTEEAKNAEGDTTTSGQLAAVTDLTAKTGYDGVVKLSWTAAPNATAYVVSYGDESVTVNRTKATIKGLKTHKEYVFKVVAKADGFTDSAEASVSCMTDRKIKHISYKFTMKGGVTLQPHGGSKKNIRLKQGETIEAYRFKSGKYVINRGKGIYYINRVRARNPRAVYTKKFNYSRTEAENYVNAIKMSSKKKYLIWVSTYTQHGYCFKGSKGKWKCIRDWELATGKADTPTPTGVDGKVQLWLKLNFRHGLHWWSCFSTYNAFHGKAGSWDVGDPASGGCIRCLNKDAKWIYNNVPIKTRVYIY